MTVSLITLFFAAIASAIAGAAISEVAGLTYGVVWVLMMSWLLVTLYVL